MRAKPPSDPTHRPGRGSGGDLPRITPRRLAVGLALGLLVAVGAGTWGLARARAAQERQREVRDAVILAAELAELTGRAGLEAEPAGRLVEHFAELHPAAVAIRVIDLGAKRLVASTAPGDVGETAAPRRLARDEKPLYDLGQELRAAVETNRREGRAWKPEIQVRRQQGHLEAAAPIESTGENGQVVGAVVVETVPEAATTTREAGAPPPRPPAASGPPYRAALFALLAPLALFALVAVGLGKLRPHPAGLTLVAGVLLVASAAAFGTWSVGALTAGAQAADRELASRLAAEAESSEPLLASLTPSRGAANTGLDPARWDVDAFRRPRTAGAGPERAVLARRLTRLAVGSGIVAVALFLYFGLGVGARTGRVLSRHRRAYFYVLPALVAMVVLVYFPFLYGIALSFTNANIYNSDQPITETWTGLENFREILGDTDVIEETPEGRAINYSSFYWTLAFTVVWTIANVSIGVSVGLLLALILHRKGFALKPFYRVILILPWAMPNYITALIWRGMFHSQLGVINQILQLLGGHAVSWFDTPATAFVTVLATNGWLSFPFMMVISLGALQSIPADLYEAARVDGATARQQFRSITLPSLKPALVPAVILSVIWTFNMFNIIYLVSGGQPAGSTEILITQAYKIAFEQYRYGYAAAYSTVIFLILFAYGAWQNWVTRATESL